MLLYVVLSNFYVVFRSFCRAGPICLGRPLFLFSVKFSVTATPGIPTPIYPSFKPLGLSFNPCVMKNICELLYFEI